jgi:sorbitol-specific phosphotransferase system component IIA
LRAVHLRAAGAVDGEHPGTIVVNQPPTPMVATPPFTG